MSCSFLDIVGGVCGAEERARHHSTQTVSLSSCSKDISSHKRFLQFSGIETEIELILARSGIFVKPTNFSEMTICPLHRSSLGIGWRRASRLCSVPQDVSGHKKESKEVPAAERGITLQHSIQIFELTKNLIPVGSGKRSQWVILQVYPHFMQGSKSESLLISRRVLDGNHKLHIPTSNYFTATSNNAKFISKIIFMSYEFSVFLPMFWLWNLVQTLAISLNIFTSFKTNSKLMAWEKLELIYSKILELLQTMLGRKKRNVKDWLVTR